MTTYTVTGAFSFSGKHITAELLAQGAQVRTITRRSENPFAQEIPVVARSYDSIETLTKALEGTQVLINTYWRRLPDKSVGYDDVIKHSKNLFTAATEAGVKRIVHCSIANPIHAQFSYFKAKSVVEEEVRASGISCAVIRPQLIFGSGELLINNLAWFLRKSSLMMVPGDGEYLVQPIHAHDYAKQAVALANSDEQGTTNAVGPRTYSYNAFVQMVGEAVGRKPHLMHMNPKLFLAGANIANKFFHEPTLTDFEVYGCLMGTFKEMQQPTGKRTLEDWLLQNGDLLGRRYAHQDARPYECKR